jgi:hypothetical protein
MRAVRVVLLLALIAVFGVATSAPAMAARPLATPQCPAPQRVGQQVRPRSDLPEVKVARLPTFSLVLVRFAAFVAFLERRPDELTAVPAARRSRLGALASKPLEISCQSHGVLGCQRRSAMHPWSAWALTGRRPRRRSTESRPPTLLQPVAGAALAGFLDGPWRDGEWTGGIARPQVAQVVRETAFRRSSQQSGHRFKRRVDVARVRCQRLDPASRPAGLVDSLDVTLDAAQFGQPVLDRLHVVHDGLPLLLGPFGQVGLVLVGDLGDDLPDGRLGGGLALQGP